MYHESLSHLHAGAAHALNRAPPSGAPRITRVTLRAADLAEVEWDAEMDELYELSPSFWTLPILQAFQNEEAVSNLAVGANPSTLSL